MTLDIIVWAAVGLAAVFIGAWLLRPELRRRIERPKHQFAERVRRYDRSLHG